MAIHHDLLDEFNKFNNFVNKFVPANKKFVEQICHLCQQITNLPM